MVLFLRQGSVAAIPFTGGASAAGVAIGAGLTIGTVTISTTELAIICGTVIALKGIDKGCKVKFSPDGGVEVSPQYKE